MSNNMSSRTINNPSYVVEPKPSKVRRGPYRKYLTKEAKISRQTRHSRLKSTIPADPVYPEIDLPRDAIIGTQCMGSDYGVQAEQFDHDSVDSEDDSDHDSVDSEDVEEYFDPAVSDADSDCDGLDSDTRSDTSSDSFEDNSARCTNVVDSEVSKDSCTNESEFKIPKDWQQPLYEKATITLGQSVVIIMAFVLSAGLTQSACEELLQLLTVFLPPESLLPATKYLLNKYFLFKPESSQTIYYCPDCFNALTDMLFCSICNKTHEIRSLKANHNFFLYLPMLPQLRNLLEARGFGNKLRMCAPEKPEDGLLDISDGAMYKDFMGGILTKDNSSISLTFNTDGVPLFKSSSFSIWPLQSFINELPAGERKTNFLLSGLWFGSCKPSVTTFFKPFINELQTLGSVGFNWLRHGSIVHSLVFAVACCCDSVARAMLQNIKQFNGHFGCSWCHAPGQQLKKGKGSVRVYPAVKNCLRSDKTVRDCARKACSDGEDMLGIKGPSPLSLIPGFNMACGFVSDYMHSVDLGVTRQLSHLWFDSKYHNKPWYLGKSIEKINVLLLSIMPPSNVTRSPRSLATRAFWKANEWRAFLLCYAPVILNNILPPPYFEHLVELSSIMFAMQCEFISYSKLVTVSLSVDKFVSSFEDLYGLENMSYNVHLMQHMTDCVKNWGPLWGYSAYSFESANGLFLKLFHGTQAVGKQIATSFLFLQRLHEMIPITCNRETDETFLNMLSRFVSVSDLRIVSRGIAVSGNSVVKYCTRSELSQIELFVGYSVSHALKSYSKLNVNGQVYYTSQYTRSTKRCNSVVVLNDGSVVVVTDILYVEASVSSEHCYICFVKSVSTCESPTFHVRLASEITGSFRIIRPEDIRQKCVVHKQNNVLVAVALLPNNLEKD